VTVESSSPPSPAPATPRFYDIVRSPAYRRNPYPLLRELRSNEPVHQAAASTWVLTRFNDVSKTLRDPRLSNAEPVAAEDTSKPDSVRATSRDQALPPSITALDPPEHTRVRSMLAEVVTPKLADELHDRIEAIVDERLGRLADRETVDLVTDFAYPVPLTLICDLLGIDRSNQERVRAAGDVVATIGDPDALVSVDQQQAARRATATLARQLSPLILRRRREHVDDLLGRLMNNPHGDGLSFGELLVNGMFLLLSGYFNTVSLIANGTLALLRHPRESAALREGRSVERNDVEELCRFESPVQIVYRFTLAHYEIGSAVIPPQHRLLLHVGAANRDPEQFAQPDELQLARPNARRNLAFGAGPHFCLGSTLAKAEAGLAVGSLLRRFPGLALAGEPVPNGNVTLRGLRHLPVSTGRAMQSAGAPAEVARSGET
jgi:cytochrome P450